MRKVPTICCREMDVVDAYLEEEGFLRLFVGITVREVVFDAGMILELHERYVADGGLPWGRVP